MRFLNVWTESKMNLPVKVLTLDIFTLTVTKVPILDFDELACLMIEFDGFCIRSPKKRYMGSDFYVATCLTDR